MTANDAHKAIAEMISNHNVVLFMKGTADFPMCGFSSTVVQILEHCQVPFQDVNILETEELREGIKTYSKWPTIPQLYVKGEFIGGCDIVREMYENGELQTLLSEKNITATC